MAIEVAPLTMLVRMRASGIQRIVLLSWYKEAAIEYGVSEDAIFQFLNDFCLMSARILHNGKDPLPFELGLATDTPEELRRKFDMFINANVHEVDALEQLIETNDAPHDPDKAPDVELIDPEEEGDEKNG